MIASLRLDVSDPTIPGQIRTRDEPESLKVIHLIVFERKRGRLSKMRRAFARTIEAVKNDRGHRSCSCKKLRAWPDAAEATANHFRHQREC